MKQTKPNQSQIHRFREQMGGGQRGGERAVVEEMGEGGQVVQTSNDNVRKSRGCNVQRAVHGQSYRTVMIVSQHMQISNHYAVHTKQHSVCQLYFNRK